MLAIDYSVSLDTQFTFHYILYCFHMFICRKCYRSSYRTFSEYCVNSDPLCEWRWTQIWWSTDCDNICTGLSWLAFHHRNCSKTFFLYIRSYTLLYFSNDAVAFLIPYLIVQIAWNNSVEIYCNRGLGLL